MLRWENLKGTGWRGSLIKACKKKFSVVSVPIDTEKVDGTGSSNFRPLTDTWQAGKLLLRIVFGFRGK